jgi:hydrogenase small subunit
MMRQENVFNKRLLKVVESSGLNRREFLKYCAAAAALFGLSETELISGIVNAMETKPGKPPVMWLEGLACAGCTISLTQSLNPPISSVILDKISLRQHDTIMAAAGHLVEEVYDETVKEGGFLLIVEGAIPSADDRFCMVGGRPFRKLVEDAAKKANAVLAVGACSAFGGIPRATPSKGIAVTEALKNAKIDKPVINISTCPVHPDHLVGTILYVLITGKIPELDSKGRPAMYFGDKRLIHDNCRRRGHFDAGEFLTDWNDPKQKDWCLLQKGCKGPMSYTDCSIRRWNDGINFCLDCGGLCQACGDPEFYEKVAPLYTAESEASRKIIAMREAGMFKSEKC